MPRLDKATIILGACCLSPRLNRIRLFVKIPLLADEAAAVRTTELISNAAKGTPANANNETNGLFSGLICVHGTTIMMTASAPT